MFLKEVAFLDVCMILQSRCDHEVLQSLHNTAKTTGNIFRKFLSALLILTQVKSYPKTNSKLNLY